MSSNLAMTVTPSLPTTLSTRGASVSEMGYLLLKTHQPVKVKDSFAKLFDNTQPKKIRTMDFVYYR
jgi:hypothetical protein